MVECGSMSSPPSFRNLTVWGIITFVIMLVIGITSINSVVPPLGFNHFFIDLLNLIGGCFGVAGLVFAILSIIQSNAAHLKISMTCYFVSCLIMLLSFILGIIYSDPNVNSILHLLLCIFLCYLFYVQSKNFSSTS